MRRFAVLALVLLSLSAEWVAGAEPDAQESSNLPTAEARPRHPSLSYRLITPAFQGALTKEQLEKLGPAATPEQLRDMMTPVQRGAARAALAAAEAKATTPEELKEIVRGYLILDEDGPQQGQNAIRLAETLQASSPQDSEGFALAASGYHQMGDYPAATEWAQRALELNPNDERARAVYALSKGRTKRGAGSAPGIKGTAASGPDGITAAGAEFTIPEKHDIAPEALTFVRQAIAARRRGDMAGAWSNVQAAMNADPKSLTVQKLFGMAKEDQAKHTDTLEFLRLSREALDAGHNEEAVAWAQRAYERSGNPTVQKILDLTRRTADERAQQSVKKDMATGTPKKEQRNGFPPLATTAAVMAGVLLLAWAATPQAVKDRFRQDLWENPKQELKLGAAALATAAVLYGGWSLLAAASAASTSAPVAGQLAYAGAGAGSGGMLGTAIAWEQAAVGALKAGTITLATMMGFKSVAERGSRAQAGDSRHVSQKSGGGHTDPSSPPGPGPLPVPLPLPIGSKPDTRDCSLQAGEDILNRFVDGTRLAPGFLDKHEKAGGHTIERHVGKPRAFLLQRIRSESKSEASSFNDLITAEDVTRQSIADKKTAIQAWYSSLNADNDYEAFYRGTHQRPIGYSVMASDQSTMLPKYAAATFLRKVGCQILIVTSYPE